MHHAQRIHTVISLLTGEEHSFTSIAGFAKANGLGTSSLSRMVNGHNKTCGTFKLKGKPNKIKLVKYHLKSPEGYLMIVSNTRKISQKYKVNRRKLDLVCTGELKSVDGWTKADDSEFKDESAVKVEPDVKEQLLKTVLFA